MSKGYADMEADTNLAQGNHLVPGLGGGVGPGDQGQIGEEKISEKINKKKNKCENGKDAAKADRESNLKNWYTDKEADTSLAGGSRLVPGLGGGVGPEDQGQTGVPASKDEVKADQNLIDWLCGSDLDFT